MQPDLVSKFKKYKGVTQWFSAYLAVMKAWCKHQHQNKRKRREKRKKEKGRKEGEEKGKDLAFTLSLKDSDDHSQSEKVHLCMVVDFEHADKAGKPARMVRQRTWAAIQHKDRAQTRKDHKSCRSYKKQPLHRLLQAGQREGRCWALHLSSREN